MESILKKYGQGHLLERYSKWNEDKKAFFKKQLEEIDLSVIDLSKKDADTGKKGAIEPIEVMKIDEINKRKDELYTIGADAIKEGKVGAVLLAGGQGTRLGSDRPKGVLDIGINKQLFIFERLIYNIMDVVNRVGAYVPLYIMTSEKNNQDTIDFLTKHQYFGYDKDYVHFFTQEMVPSVDFSGKIFLEDEGVISLSPNGNGGWFRSLVKCGLMRKIDQAGIEWLNVFSVDNVLQRIADPYFVGATIRSGHPAGSKVVKKVSPDEKVGVMCKEDGKPSIIEYYELTESMIHERDSFGEPAYNYGVILNYLFCLKDLKEIADANMPLHIVEKKIPYMNENGERINPDQPNGYKFETLILDMIHMLDGCLPYEVVRNREFAPIKNKTGVDSLETARALLQENGIEI